MISAGPAGFGLAFLVLSVMSISILLIWVRNGAMKSPGTKASAVACLAIIVALWGITFLAGPESDAAQFAVLAGPVFCLVSMFVPLISNWWTHRANDT